MAEGVPGTAVQLGLHLNLNDFLGKILIAEQEIDELIKRVDQKRSLRLKVGVDWSNFESELRHAAQLIGTTRAEIKVGTSFYKGGSNFKVSKTALKREILDPLQNNIKDDLRYQIRVGAHLDPEALAKIKKQLQAEVSGQGGSSGGKIDAVRQDLIGLTRTEGQGGINAKALRDLQKAASEAGIKTSATGAKELRAELATAFQSAGEDAIRGLAIGLAKGQIQLKGISEDVGKSMIAALKKALGIASPSKEGKKIGENLADSTGSSFVSNMVGWERQMARAIRQSVAQAWQDGLKRDQAARSAMSRMGSDAGAVISSSLSKALKQGLSSAIVPALKGGLLGAAGGAATGGLVGGLRAAGGAVQEAVTPSMLTFGYGSVPMKLGMLGHGAANLATGQASEQLAQFIQNSVDTVLNAALQSGSQGAMLGAAGVAGVAGVVGLAKGTSGSLVSQAVESIKNKILGTAIKEAREQAQITGSTGGAVSAPISNGANIAGLLQGAIGATAKGLLAVAKNLDPRKINDGFLNLVYNLTLAAEQFGEVRKDANILAAKISEAWNGLSGITPERLLPPPLVPGTQLTRNGDIQLGSVIGRTALDFRRPNVFGVLGGRIGPEEAGRVDPNYTGSYLDQTRKALVPQNLGWKIIDQVNGVWKRIKSDAELAAEFQQRIRDALKRESINRMRGSRNADRISVYEGDIGPGFFNPFDKPFYRDSAYMGPPGRYANQPGLSYRLSASVRGKTTLGGTFGGSRGATGPRDPDFLRFSNGGPPDGTFSTFRRATQQPPGALALRNEPVELFKSFRDAQKLIALVNERLSNVNRTFDTLKVKSKIQVDQSIRELDASLRAVLLGFRKGEVSASDARMAVYGLNREMAGIGAKSSEIQNLAQAFENLGIQSRAAYDSIQDQRNIDLRFIESTLGQKDAKGREANSEVIRARNARDIQQLERANSLVRTAQGASGFGGFRGREIGNDTLNKAQSRSQLANAIREMKEYQQTLKLTETNAKTFSRIQQELAREIQNATTSYRVLNNTASDGERITVLARNAWGTILDDFKNLVPQLLVFAVAYNLILQRVMATPGAVLQAAAAFDRLDTSISTYLSATRGMGDVSGELGKVRGVALDLGVGYEKAAKSYLNFAAATQGTPLEGREADISRTLFTAGRNQGLSGEQLDRAATALTQILSKGRVQAEELRGQLAEQLPGAVQVAARAYGVTTKELYRMVEAGQLASDEFVDKFMKQLVAEGAGVNQMASSFTNVTEQLGSSFQMLAAAAGQPILAPLTEALRLLNTAITGLIPLGGPLAAFFIAMGSNALKSKLKIDSWVQGITQIAGGNSGVVSGILGPDGKPLPRAGQRPGMSIGDRGRAFASGIGSIIQGSADIRRLGRLRNSDPDAIDKLAEKKTNQIADGWKQATSAVTGFTVGLGGANAGLAGAVRGAKSFAMAMREALLPALKLYLIFEGLTAVIKLVKGEVGALGDELKRSTSLKEGTKNPMGLNAVQRFLARLNVGKNIEEMFTGSQASQINKDSKNVISAVTRNQDKIRRVGREVAAIDKQIYDEKQKRDVASTKTARDESEKRINVLKGEREKALKQIDGLTPERVRAQITPLKAAIQAQQEKVKRAGSLGDTVYGKANLKEQQAILEEYQNTLKQLENAAQVYNAFSPAKTLGVMQARQDLLQESNKNTDVNSEQYKKNLIEISGLQKAIQDQGLLPQERTLAVMESRQKALTAEMQTQETLAKVRLGILENERKMIEANLDLEKTRGRLREVLASQRVEVANSVNAPEAALSAQADLRAVQAANQATDIAAQRELIVNDKNRANVQLTLQQQQIELQKTQIGIDLQMLAIEKAKIQAAVKTKEISVDLINNYTQLLGSITRTERAVRSQIPALDQTSSLLEEQKGQEMAIMQIRLETLGVTNQVNQAEARGAAILDEIKRRQLEIDANEKGQVSLIKFLNIQLEAQVSYREQQLDNVRSLIEAERVRMQIAEQIASSQMEIIDRTLEMQKSQSEGGYFERLAKSMATGMTSEQDAMSLAQQRVKLMRTVQEQQNKQKILELTTKRKELEIEKAIYRLKTEQLKIANQEDRVRIRAGLEKIRLAYASVGRTADAERLRALLNQEAGGTNGPAKDTLSTDEGDLLQQLKINKYNRVNIEGNGAIAVNTIDEASASIETQVAALKEEQKIRDSLLQQDASSWFASFLDNATSLGRVLTEAAQGLTDFRQNVSKGLVEGLLGGEGDKAISDAGRQLAQRVLTSLIDEYVTKPMEKNVFTGLNKILGLEKALPAAERTAKATEVTAESARTQATEAVKANTTLESIYGKMDDIVKGLNNIVNTFEDAAKDVYKQTPAEALPAVPQQAPVESSGATGIPIRGAISNRTKDPDAEKTGWDIVVPGGVGGRISNPFGNLRITGTGFQGHGAGPSGRGYGNWVSGETEIAGKVYELFMGHFSKVAVKKGDVLGFGGTIGQQGETGRTFGTHVTTHVNPIKGASVADAWDILEKVTKAWETGKIVPGSERAPVPVVVTNPQNKPIPSAEPAPLPGQLAQATQPVQVNNVKPVALEVIPWTEGMSPVPVQLPDASAQSIEPQQSSLPTPQETEETNPYLSPFYSMGGGFGTKQQLDFYNSGAEAWKALDFSNLIDFDQWREATKKLTEESYAMGDVMKQGSEAIAKTSSSFNKVSDIVGGIATLLGSIGMGIAGVNQMKKGGTYNVLMGLAGIFGSVSSIAGGFVPGGNLSRLFRARGGPITARKPYIVGEQGPELIFPEHSGTVYSASRTSNVFAKTRAMLEKQRYAGESDNSAMKASPIPGSIDVRYESTVINSVEYVTAEQHRKGMREAAKMGQALAYQGLQSSVQTRKRIGI